MSHIVVVAKVVTTSEFDAWVEGLRDRRGRAVILRRVARLEIDLWGDAKSVGDGVIELRIDFGPGYRVYVAKRGEDVVILLCGGDKSSQSRDIKRATALASELE